MTFEDLVRLINMIDALTDREFETLYNIIHIRAMRRAQARYPKPQDQKEGDADEMQNSDL
ncbi:unnamed protein product [marine sediment metagenome]|uniref:Uncharacterized protein n=1 Tax=marine sediment metagenome TaxID=412755 RepID=X1KAJ4_9ZZZZ